MRHSIWDSSCGFCTNCLATTQEIADMRLECDLPGATLIRLAKKYGPWAEGDGGITLGITAVNMAVDEILTRQVVSQPG